MEKGLIVFSRAGHDKGGAFVVVDVTGDFCFLVDGKERPLQKPKKKRTKHLCPTLVRLDEADFETNKRLKKSLAIFKASLKKEESDLG